MAGDPAHRSRQERRRPSPRGAAIELAAATAQEDRAVVFAPPLPHEDVTVPAPGSTIRST